MNDAFHITRGSLASGLFRQFRERARLRYKYVDQVAAHGSGNSPNGTERDAVLGFGLFELLDGLSRCPHFLADLALAKAEGRSEEHTSELQSLTNLVCRLLLEKKKKDYIMK